MTWWRKRTTERDALRRTLTGITVKTHLEVAMHDMQRALDHMVEAVANMPVEDDRGDS